MTITIKDLKIKTLGDPHLGRKFIHGVPLERKGEREERQGQDFARSLDRVEDIDLHVCMGDIFDKAVIPAEVLIHTTRIYRQAAESNPDVTYILIRGNHDGFRDIDRISSFDILAELLDPVPNIHVFKQPGVMMGLGFCPWDPVIPAREIITTLPENVTCVFGHWDTESYGGSEHNLIPTAEMAARGITEAVTGHIHLPSSFERDGVAVTVTGSMEPYSHAEDPEGKLYITTSLEEYLKAPLGQYHDKCLRIDLQAGEKIDFEIDCLQLATRRVDDSGEVEKMDVTLGDFDFEQLFVDAFKEEEVPVDIIEIIKHKYDEMRSEDA